MNKDPITELLERGDELEAKAKERPGYSPEVDYKIHCIDTRRAHAEIIRMLVDALDMLADKMPRCECVDGHGFAIDSLAKARAIAEGALK